MSDTGGRQVAMAGAVLGGAGLAAAVYLYYTSASDKASHHVSGGMRGVPGLYNLGNTCYANALLQGLASVPSVVRWLEQIDLRGSTWECGFVAQLADMMKKLNSCSERAYSAGDVIAALSQHNWYIQHGAEHDLHELFNVFATTWEEELSCARRECVAASLWDVGRLWREAAEGAARGDGAGGGDRKQLVFERCASEVGADGRLLSPVFGLTATQLQCCVFKCGYKKVRQDRFSVISLSIPQVYGGVKVSVESMLRRYFSLEVIRGATCDKCKKESGKTDSGLSKKQGLSKLPQVLVIRVERVGVNAHGYTHKVDRHVDFAETLDLAEFCFFRDKQDEYSKAMNAKRQQQGDDDSRTPERTWRIVGGACGGGATAASSNIARIARQQPGFGHAFATIDGGSFVAERRDAAKYRYRLCAVSEHRGQVDTGHFVTYRRGVSDHNAWYLTNDAEVRRVAYSQVASAQAYMLYYERIQTNRWYKGDANTLHVAGDR